MKCALWLWSKAGPFHPRQHLLAAYPNRHIWLAARGHCRTRPNLEKTISKEYLLFRVLFLVEHLPATLLAIWMAAGALHECFHSWKQLTVIWTVASGSETSQGQSVFAMIAPSRKAPSQTAAGTMQCSPSDQGLPDLASYHFHHPNSFTFTA